MKTDKQTTLERLDIQAFYGRFFPSLKDTGKSQALVNCTFHDDKNPSLSINLEDGRYNCFSCGAKGDVFTFYQELKKVDFPTALKEIAVMAGITDTQVKQKTVAIFHYTDVDGKRLYLKERVEPGRNGRKKEFIFHHRDKTGKKQTGRGESEAVPYRLHEIIKAETIYIQEGEGKADYLASLGLAATCFDSGASSKWHDRYISFFEGKEVVIIPDNDTAGEEYLQTIATALRGKAKSLKALRLPGLKEKGDLLDWVKDAGNDKERLLELMKEAPEWEPTEEPDARELEEPDHWPVPNPAIYHGLSGEIVRAIEPHTEADPIALQVQTLVIFGNIIGRGAWLEIEADRHYTNQFIALVGESSKARKGTSLSHIIRLSKTVDPEWERERVQNGLSSAEGAIYAVRDEVRKGDTVIDEGVADKRLMLIEPELASVLKVASREGNTLSAMLRQSWDGRTLRTLTKNSPLKALISLVSLISHVTKEELLRYLTSTEAGNGFANRFLWVAVRRSKCLPRGGQISKVDFQPILKKLKAAVHFAKDAGLIEPTEDTWLIWEKVYPELSEGKPGLLGAVTSRAEAHVMRLALIYALMDHSSKIKPEHLMAALALWDYCNESAQYIFGDSSGNPIADEILIALKNNPEGLTRTDISNLFGRHKQKGEIAQSLIYLSGKGLITKTQIETGGRSTELWTAKKAN